MVSIQNHSDQNRPSRRESRSDCEYSISQQRVEFIKQLKLSDPFVKSLLDTCLHNNTPLFRSRYAGPLSVLSGCGFQTIAIAARVPKEHAVDLLTILPLENFLLLPTAAPDTYKAALFGDISKECYRSRISDTFITRLKAELATHGITERFHSIASYGANAGKLTRFLSQRLSSFSLSPETLRILGRLSCLSELDSKRFADLIRHQVKTTTRELFDLLNRRRETRCDALFPDREDRFIPNGCLEDAYSDDFCRPTLLSDDCYHTDAIRSCLRPLVMNSVAVELPFVDPALAAYCLERAVKRLDNAELSAAARRNLPGFITRSAVEVAFQMISPWKFFW